MNDRDEPPRRRKKPEISIREMTIDDLAEVFHLGERVFTASQVPNLYRTWKVIHHIVGDRVLQQPNDPLGGGELRVDHVIHPDPGPPELDAVGDELFAPDPSHRDRSGRVGRGDQTRLRSRSITTTSWPSPVKATAMLVPTSPAPTMSMGMAQSSAGSWIQQRLRSEVLRSSRPSWCRIKPSRRSAPRASCASVHAEVCC